VVVLSQTKSVWVFILGNTWSNKMSNPKRIGLKERPRRTPAARELSQRNSPYNLQVGAAELGGVIQKYGGNYILAFAGHPAERYQKATMSIRPRLRAT